MSDPFEDLLRRWLRDRGGTDHAALQALAGNVAALPPRRRRTASPIAAAAAVILALGLGALALAPRFGPAMASPSASVPVPPDPAAFAGDPRLTRCGATPETAIDAFEMRHARDYRLHLPAMGLSPELDVDGPAFVVVYRGVQPFATTGGAGASGATPAPPRATPEPGTHDVCVLMGPDPATAELNVYENVDISGLTVTVASLESTPGPPSVEPSAPDVGLGSPTPEPAPAWAGDARIVLECDGSRVDLGREAQPNPDETQSDTPDGAVQIMIERGWALRLPVPRTGLVSTIVVDGADLFVYRVDGRGRVRAAVAVVRRQLGPDPVWVVGSVASCDPAEFDAMTTSGANAFGIWSDAAGQPVKPSILSATPDCYRGTQVRYQGRLYVRSPYGGVDPSQTDTTWAANVAIPRTAIATPYRSGDQRLFLAADGRAIYVVVGTLAERLPHVRGEEVLRTDCN